MSVIMGTIVYRSSPSNTTTQKPLVYTYNVYLGSVFVLVNNFEHTKQNIDNQRMCDLVGQGLPTPLTSGS